MEAPVFRRVVLSLLPYQPMRMQLARPAGPLAGRAWNSGSARQ